MSVAAQRDIRQRSTRQIASLQRTPPWCFQLTKRHVTSVSQGLSSLASGAVRWETLGTRLTDPDFEGAGAGFVCPASFSLFCNFFLYFLALPSLETPLLSCTLCFAQRSRVCLTAWQAWFNALTFLSLWAFLEWQVVTVMKTEQIIESLANYIWLLRVVVVVFLQTILRYMTIWAAPQLLHYITLLNLLTEIVLTLLLIF